MVVDMRPVTKLSSYALVLVAVLGGGAAVGAAVGPIDLGDEPATHASDDHGGETTHDEGSDLPAAGLLVAQDGYTLVPDTTTLAGGTPFGFVVTGPDGHAVVDFDVEHDKQLHLIVASRDLRRFAHVHPERDADGRWRVDLPDLPPGPYRAFADFRPTGGPALVLGVDVVVPGELASPTPLLASTVVDVDGFEVTLDGHAEAGTTSTMTVTVRRDGEVVTTAPYLGAAGHLVALRDGDLAYLHVHPLDDEPAGPVRFGVELPSSGTYALFFDFLVDGTVHTAPFVLEVTR
jgi:hypothetical protein